MPDLDEILTPVLRETPALPSGPTSLFVRELLSWNARVALVSRRTTTDTVIRLIRQSAQLWGAVVAVGGGHRAAVDVGSGAGFPGVVWKLLCPELNVLLVERREKKAAFLARLPAILPLDGLDVFAGDAREAATRPRWANRFDVGAALAVGSIEETVAIIDGFLLPSAAIATIRPISDILPAAPGRGFLLQRQEPGPDGVLAVYARPDSCST